MTVFLNASDTLSTCSQIPSGVSPTLWSQPLWQPSGLHFWALLTSCCSDEDAAENRRKGCPSLPETSRWLPEGRQVFYTLACDKTVFETKPLTEKADRQRGAMTRILAGETAKAESDWPFSSHERTGCSWANLNIMRVCKCIIFNKTTSKCLV